MEKYLNTTAVDGSGSYNLSGSRSSQRIKRAFANEAVAECALVVLATFLNTRRGQAVAKLTTSLTEQRRCTAV